ncbi:MAG: CHAD domain-containing protein [Solirubrobacterales bacterium]
MAQAAPIPGLDEEIPYALAAARVVSVRARELIEHSEGVLDITDIERVHDMRVATRRLRAALEVFEPCFPRKSFDAALSEVKELADALGERRDRDVTIAALAEIQTALGAADRAGVEALISSLRREQAQANEALAPFVSAKRLAALRERLDELTVEAEALVPRAQPQPPSLRVVA